MDEIIINKFKILNFSDKIILNKPQDINAFNGVVFDTAFCKKSYDLIFAFIFSLDEFTTLIAKVIGENLLNPNGYLYFAYPKKGNKQYREYIGRDDFFPQIEMDADGFVNGSGIKFNKMAAFNDVFTCIGLKHEARRGSRSSQPSQCVADYIDRIPELKHHFAGNRAVLDNFERLTPGYQRDWARYVFGVKKEETRMERLANMEKILKEGYKSIDLYRAQKK